MTRPIDGILTEERLHEMRRAQQKNPHIPKKLSNKEGEEKRERIINCLRKGARMRREIAQEVRLSRTTVYDVLKKLMDEEIVIKSKGHMKRRGRPWVFFELKEV